MTIHQSPDDSPSGSQDSPSDASNGFGAGLSTPASADSEPRRKRRSSSRRRTTKKATGESTQRAQEEAVSPSGAKRSARKSQRSSGRAEKDERTSSARSEDERDDERPKRKRRSRSRARTTRDEREGESEKRSGASSGSQPKAAPVVGFLPEDGDEKSDQDKDESRSKSATRRKRSARTRSRRKASRQEDDDRDEREEDEEEDAPRSRSRKARSSKAKKATKKRTRRKTKRSDRDRDDSDDDRDDDDRDEDEETPKRKRRASKKRSKANKTPEELAAEEEALRTKTILVNATDPEERRVVLVEGNGRIEDLLMTAESQKNLVNDIYRGKVVNLEPAIGAAFVDFGQGRNGFLHTSDVMPVYGEDDFTLEKLLTTRLHEDDADLDLDDGDLDDDFDDGDDREEEERPRRGRGRSGRKKKAKAKVAGSAARRGRAAMQRRTRQRLPITDLLKVGDPVVVQITKDAIGDKGPTLTTYISIPGRYLVLMPSMARTGVSRKIPDENERRRLKRILAQLDAPEEMGVIVRTAGVGKLKTDLKRDLSYLLGVWKTFEKKLKTGRGPTPLYQESDVATRTLRDLFNKETKEVVVDDFAVHEQMMEFAERLMPEHAHRISRYEGQRPIFHHFGIEQDFEVIFNRRVELPSGGSIVFDQAEALVAIDVNSGRTRTGSHDFEEIALKTNLEAVPEIALQIRLRDLGGIIVCDFIDMMKSSSNRAVEKALRSELAKDRARSKMGRIGQFGLLEMTRQRLGPGTHKKVFQACPRCRGTGRIRTVQSRAQAILRRLGSALTQKGFSTVEVRAHPEVVQYIKDKLWDYVRALEHRFERELRWTEVPDQPEDSVLRYLRTDGREVRPGGRRKR